jgi:hypothetical protein
MSQRRLEKATDETAVYRSNPQKHNKRFTGKKQHRQNRL